MEHQAFLLTVAQVATAYVGFSMLISAISPQTAHSDLRRSLLYHVASIGFIVLGGALSPYAIAASSLSIESTWRLSSCLLSLVAVVSVTFAYRRVRTITGRVDISPVMGSLLSRINPLLVATANALLLWNVVFPGPNSGARYLGALLLLLLIATYAFMRAGFELQARPSDEQS